MTRKGSTQDNIYIAILISVFAISVLPVIIMFIRSWKTLPQVGRSQIFVTLPLHYGNYIEAWALVQRYLLNTIFVVVTSVIGVVLLSSITAYVLRSLSIPRQEHIVRCHHSFADDPGCDRVCSFDNPGAEDVQVEQ